MNNFTRRDFLGVTFAAGVGLIAIDSIPVQAQERGQSSGNKDIYAIIKQDHENVMSQIDKMKKGTQEQDLLKLRQLILPHAKAEEVVFYPVLQDEMMILKATEEHHAVENLLNEMKNTPPTEKKFQAQLSVLKEMLQHHMKEEEGEVFKKAKKNLKGDQAKEIGQKFQTKKQELLGTIS